jgi:predicted CoA-binding protein
MARPTVAILGASANRAKFGNKAVRAFALRGWDVFPINPRASTIEGFPAYPSVGAVPIPALDRVSVYLPPEVGLRVLDDLTHKPVGEVWLNPGADSPELVAEARRRGLNVVLGCSILAIGVDPHALA